MPQRGAPYSFSRGLYDATFGGHFRVNPTIAVGDFQISKDSGPFVNLTTVPTVTPAGSALVLFQLTAAEMTANRITILGVDQAGGEWTDFMEHLDTTTVLEVADTVLTRDWTFIGTTPPAYSIWNALRAIRNIWNIVPGTPPVLHIKAEDGVSDAWVRQVTTSPTADPVTGVQ